MLPLFNPHVIGPREKSELDQQGHLILPGLLTQPARDALVAALGRVLELHIEHGPEAPGERSPSRYAAEHDSFLASLIAHPQMLALGRSILGDEIRYDHCVALSRVAAFPGMRWHSHEYSDADPRLGFLRIFFYVNGFEADDGGLKVVPGSHLFRDSCVTADDDAALASWLAGKRHLVTGEPLQIEHLVASRGSVILMWTHALHGVAPRRAGSDTRWTVVYGYRNPGRPSRSRWISEAFEQHGLPGTEGLMGLY